MIKLIVALGKNNLIGNNDKMPWHISEEFKHFKKTTMNSWLLMGETTFKGLPSKLPGRKICVLSPNNVDGAEHQVHNEVEMKEFLEKFKGKKEDIFIAGGKSVYENFYPLAEELIVSRIKGNKYEGNVYMNWNLDSYKETLVKDFPEFTVYKYTKEKNEN